MILQVDGIFLHISEMSIIHSIPVKNVLKSHLIFLVGGFSGILPMMNLSAKYILISSFVNASSAVYTLSSIIVLVIVTASGVLPNGVAELVVVS